jgi:predicted metalloprotease
MPRTLFAFACLATLLAAGSTAAPFASAETSTSTSSSASSSASTATAAPGTAAAQSTDLASVVDATVDDIQAWWADQLPDVYGDQYEPIPDDRVIAYSDNDPPPACGGTGSTPYEQVAGNAFYCSEGDFIAWDEQELFPRLQQKFGAFAVALVLAHEWGHAIQARTNSSINATIYLETQADCFAGSWAHHVEEDNVSLPIDDRDLDIALGGFLEFRDPPGVNPSQQGAHGNAFDRVSAFQDGFDDGTERCADYESNPPEVTETGFSSQEDYATGGDLPLDQTIELIRPDLDDYWSSELDGGSPVKDVVANAGSSCDGTSDGGVLVDDVTYCSSDDSVRYDTDALEQVYDASGDFGAGMVFAAAWSSGAMDRMGLAVTSDSAHTRADCLTGSWAGDVSRGVRARSRGDEGISLSPGDLDEGIATFVSLGDAEGSAFSRVAAFRKGFFKGADACTA